MKSDKIPVLIRLETVILDDNGEERNSSSHAGMLRRAEHADIITYEEEYEGSIVRNLVTVKSASASIKRSGAVGMHQSFKPDGITENVYQHPHGSLHMETRTERFFHGIGPDGGKLEIAYTVRLNGQEERNHQLMFEYEKEADGE